VNKVNKAPLALTAWTGASVLVGLLVAKVIRGRVDPPDRPDPWVRRDPPVPRVRLVRPDPLDPLGRLAPWDYLEN